MRILWIALLLGFTVSVSAAWAEETAVPRFDIIRFRLDGNTILGPVEVNRILDRYTGPQKDFGTIQEAMDALEAAYRDHGYSLVTVLLPEQELKGGVIRLVVLEPVTKEVVVAGNRHYSRDNILRSLPTLKTGLPPQMTAISANLRVANENIAKKLTLQFKPLEQPDQLQALVQVKDERPWKVALTGDNTGTSQSGYYRLGLSLMDANLWDLDHVAALSYTTSPDHADKVKIISGSYRIPLYTLGDTIDLFGGYSDVDNGTTQIANVGNLSISGKGIVSGLRYNLTLPRIGAYEQKLSLGMDYRQYDNSVQLFGAELAKDVVAHPFSLTYGGSWSGDLISVDGYIGVLHNEPWGGLGHQQDYQQVRAGAVADYWIFRYGFNKMLRLPQDWAFRVAGNGQYTPDRLIPGEQFGLGGATAVRGYDEREEAWDAGFAGSVELYSPDLARLLEFPKDQFRLVGFFDGGTGYNLRPQATEAVANSLRSVGTGFRLGIGELFSFSLDWGYALDNSTTTRRGGNAVHFKGVVTY